MSWKLTGYLLGATAFVACPCHLPLTLPLTVALLGGTAWGAALSQNTGLIYGIATAYFVLGLLTGMRLTGMWRKRRSAQYETRDEVSGKARTLTWKESS